MADSNIEWTDKVWNPVTGCTKVSEGCRNCYAEKMSKRQQGMGTKGYEDGFKVTCHEDRLDQSLRWKKPRRVFVCSMGDLFHKDVPDEFILSVFGHIMAAQKHTFIILTKRPERIPVFMEDIHTFPPNIQIGTSVEDQPTADERIPHLLKLKNVFPEIKIFVSYEPALGPVFFDPFFEGSCLHCYGQGEGVIGEDCPTCHGTGDGPSLDWVVMGGESGHGARPMHPDWARSVRDQCEEAGVPFMFKQWGEWSPFDTFEEANAEDGWGTRKDLKVLWREGIRGSGLLGDPVDAWKEGCRAFKRVGKKAAGNLLDGKEHMEVI